MIKHIRLINWKSFEDATLYIDPLTIIIGTNASGKSNTLDAFVFLNRISSGIGLFQAINGDVNLPALRGGSEWICRKPHKRFILEVRTDTAQEDQEYTYHLEVIVNGTKAEVYEETLTLVTQRPGTTAPTERVLFYTKYDEADAKVISAFFATGTKGNTKRIDLNKNSNVLSQIQSQGVQKEISDAAKYLQNEFRGIFVLSPIPSHMRDYKPLSAKLLSDGSNVAGVLAGLEEGRRKEIEDTITLYMKSLPERDIRRIWTETVGKFRTDAMLYCEEGWEKSSAHLIDARGMSDGTLRYLAIVTALLTLDRGSLLIIEEVDNGLHPSRAGLLIGMLTELGKERQIDVIATTHNPALLDAAGPRMVPFITIAHRDEDSGVSRLTQLEDVTLLPKLMASGSLGKLNSDGSLEAALRQEDAS